MQKNNKSILKIIVPVLVLVALVGIASFYLGQMTTLSTVSSTVLQSSITPVHYGFVTSSGRCANGDTVCLTGVVSTSHNVYTKFGMNATRDYLFHRALTSQAFNVTSIGMINLSQSATDRCLANGTAANTGCEDFTGSGLAPAVATVADIVGGPSDFGNVSLSKTFTCTDCSSQVINATGLYNDTSVSGSLNNTNVGNLHLFAEANFTAATLQTNDQINITWFIWTQ